MIQKNRETQRECPGSQRRRNPKRQVETERQSPRKSDKETKKEDSQTQNPHRETNKC